VGVAAPGGPSSIGGRRGLFCTNTGSISGPAGFVFCTKVGPIAHRPGPVLDSETGYIAHPAGLVFDAWTRRIARRPAVEGVQGRRSPGRIRIPE
jgi:hypothetical protein